MRHLRILIFITTHLLIVNAAFGSYHGLLYSGHRTPREIPNSFSIPQLSSLISLKLGYIPTPAKTNGLNQFDLLFTRLLSMDFQRPRLIVLGFVPLMDKEVPAGIFNNSLFPFTIDEGHKCRNHDLKCLHDSIVEFILDEKSGIVLVDQEFEFVQWASKADNKNVDVASDSFNSHLLHQVSTISDIVPALPKITIDEDSESFIISVDGNDVLFELSNPCTRTLVAETSGLTEAHSDVWRLINEEGGVQALILSPMRSLQCLKDSKASQAQVLAVEKLLLKLMESIIQKAEYVTSGQALSLVFFQSGKPLSVKSSILSINDKKDFDLDSISMIEKLQNVPPPPTSVPRMTLLWLCVVVVFAFILAVIPLLKLTKLDDPLISTKLFSSHTH